MSRHFTHFTPRHLTRRSKSLDPFDAASLHSTPTPLPAKQTPTTTHLLSCSQPSANIPSQTPIHNHPSKSASQLPPATVIPPPNTHTRNQPPSTNHLHPARTSLYADDSPTPTPNRKPPNRRPSTSAPKPTANPRPPTSKPAANADTNLKASPTGQPRHLTPPATSNYQLPIASRKPPTADSPTPTPNRKPPIADLRPQRQNQLPIPDHQPPATGHQPPTTDHRPPTTNCPPRSPALNCGPPGTYSQNARGGFTGHHRLNQKCSQWHVTQFIIRSSGLRQRTTQNNPPPPQTPIEDHQLIKTNPQPDTHTPTPP
jgi:hypothetical protein